jgi:hypothetical protein
VGFRGVGLALAQERLHSSDKHGETANAVEEVLLLQKIFRHVLATVLVVLASELRRRR